MLVKNCFNYSEFIISYAAFYPMSPYADTILGKFYFAFIILFPLGLENYDMSDLFALDRQS